MDRQAALIILLVAGCQTAPDYGEVLVEVDGEPSVPAFLSRLRVDLYRDDGTWYQSRDLAAASAADWPLSFSVYTDDHAGKSVRLRLRGYPEGGVRDFRGERYAPPTTFVDPPSAHSLTELCKAPPLLDPGQSITLRRAAHPFTDIEASGDCQPPNRAGSVAVRVKVFERASYRFEVTSSYPSAAVGNDAGDTTLFLRTACSDPTTQVACNDDIDFAVGNYLSRLIVTLDPNEYFLITGGRLGSPADLTLRWAREDQWDVTAPGVDGGAPDLMPDPRDVLEDGTTPETEPQPGLAIDLLTDIQVDYGRRRTAHLLLRGECLGAQADLRNGLTCVDTAGTVVPIAPADLEQGIHHTAESAVGSWAGEARADCTVTPRARGQNNFGDPLFDEEICIPGGAFTLGSQAGLGYGFRDPVPQQVAVVPPTLLDRYEFTVARYRDAVANGFQPPDDGPIVNDGPFDPMPAAAENPKFCTFTSQVGARERFPLNCVSWYTARALCRFIGADLPSHVAWEYAAVGSGHADGDFVYPWGNTRPDCCGAVWGRGAFSDACQSTTMTCGGVGPLAINQEPFTDNDLSADGVSGLAGNVGELVTDAAESYTSPCWWQHPLRGIACIEAEAPYRSARGGLWLEDIAFGRSAILAASEPALRSMGFGFRCARLGAP